MKTFLSKLLTCILMSFVINVCSQNTLDLAKLGSASINFKSFEGFDALKEIKGSPYLFDSWDSKSVITTAKGERYTLNNLNFNTNLDQFHAKVSNSKVFVFEDLIQVRVGKKRFLKHQGAHYEVIYFNDKGTSLLKKYTTTIKKAVYNKMTNQVLKPSRFHTKESYYILLDNGSFIKTKLRKKRFLKDITTENTLRTVKDYYKAHSISLKNEKDLFLIMKFVNSLKSELE